MSRLNNIQTKIMQLEGGRFQKLCDSYLYLKRNLENITSLGSMEGTDKTTKGIPDTYYWDKNSKGYILVMYGTHKNATSKLDKDIREAIEKSKIDKNDIKEIICCHTSSNLTVEKDKTLRDLAKPIKLTLIGIDTLSHDLLNFKYQSIVRDFLFLTESTEQVWSLNEFISMHDKSKTNAPLSTKYVESTSIINELIRDLNDNQIFLLSGVPGAGKTRIAIETCKQLSSEYNIICVKSNLINVYQDIKDALDKDRLNYLFLDDANTITDLEAVTNLLKIKEYEKNLKVLMTVRDYATPEIIDQTNSFKTKLYKVYLMSNDNIEKLIKSINFLSSNDIRKIMKLSHNNPRIAVIASNLAKDSDHNYMDSMSNVLDSYYSKIVKDNILSIEEKITLFILGFKQKVNLTNKSDYIDLLSFFELSDKEFIKSLHLLHDKELCDIFKNLAAKTRDQSLTDFIIVDFIANNHVIYIRDFFKNLYPTYKKEIINMLNIANSFKFTKEWADHLTSEIKFVYKNIIKETDTADFLTQYGAVIPIESLSYVQEKINLTEKIDFFNLSQDEFEEQQKYTNSQDNKDEIVNILSALSRSNNSRNSSVLLIEYFQKRPDKINEVFAAIQNNFNFEEINNNYLEKRINILDIFDTLPNFTETTALLIFNISKEFLKFSTEKIIFDGKEGVISNYKLSDGEYLINHRLQIFNILSKIYSYDYEKINTNIDKLIMQYPVYEFKNGFSKTVKSDLFTIEKLFFNDLKNLSLRHEALVFNLVKLIKIMNIDSNFFKNFTPSNEQIIYSIFSANELDISLDYEKNIELRKEKLKNIYKQYSGDLQWLFNALRKFQLDELLNRSEIEESIGLLYSSLKIKEKEKMLMALLNSNYVLNHHYNNFDFYIKDLPFSSSKQILDNIKKDIDDSWYFSMFLNLRDIDSNRTSEFLMFLENAKDYKSINYFNILNFLNYIEKDDSFLAILISQYEQGVISGRFFIPNYVSIDNAENIIKILGYKESQKIYLESLERGDINDHGYFLKALLADKNSHFIYSYLIKLNSLRLFGNSHAKSNIHLKYIWSSPVAEVGIRKYLNYLIKEKLVIYIGVDIYLQKLFKSNPERFYNFIKSEITTTHDEIKLFNLYNISLQIIKENEKLVQLFILLKDKEVNKDLFNSLHFSLLSKVWSGSLVPDLEEEINFLNMLLEVFTDIKYISYSMTITQKIDNLKEQIEREKLSDYLE